MCQVQGTVTGASIDSTLFILTGHLASVSIIYCRTGCKPTPNIPLRH